MNESMNENPHERTGPSEGQQTHSTHSEGPKTEQRRSVFDSLRDGLKMGAEEARKAAEETIPKVKEAASDAAYWLGYGVSFGATFAFVLGKELAPEPLKKGWRAGANDAKATAERAAADFQGRTESPASN